MARKKRMASLGFSGGLSRQAGQRAVHVLHSSLIDNGGCAMKAFIWAVAACICIGVVAGVVMTSLDQGFLGTQTLGSVRLD